MHPSRRKRYCSASSLEHPAFPKTKRETNPKGGSVPRYHLIHPVIRAFSRFKGRTPHGYSIHPAASEATFTLRLSGQLFSHEPPSLWMRKRYSSSSLAIIIRRDYSTKTLPRQCTFRPALIAFHFLTKFINQTDCAGRCFCAFCPHRPDTQSPASGRARPP